MINWDSVYNSLAANTTFTNFFDTFLTSFSRCVPLQNIQQSNKKSQNKTWVTSGIINASKKLKVLWSSNKFHNDHD
jgi:hypothetical protein